MISILLDQARVNLSGSRYLFTVEVVWNMGAVIVSGWLTFFEIICP